MGGNAETGFSPTSVRLRVEARDCPCSKRSLKGEYHSEQPEKTEMTSASRAKGSLLIVQFNEGGAGSLVACHKSCGFP